MSNAIVVHLATQLLWIVLLLSMPVVVVAVSGRDSCQLVTGTHPNTGPNITVFD